MLPKQGTPSVSQWVSSEDDVIRLRTMPNRNQITKEPPVKSGGEGWLVNAAQQLLVQFKPDTPSAQEQWVSVRTYGWKPPHPPEPQSRRRMLRPNAVEASGPKNGKDSGTRGGGSSGGASSRTAEQTGQGCGCVIM